MPVFAPAIYPPENRFVNLGKEAPAGSIAPGSYTLPLTQFKPVDKITYLEDNSWQNAMSRLYNLVPGVRIADISLGGPVFPDGIGYALADTLGDYWQAIAGTSTAGTQTSLSVSSAIGATQVVVSSGTGISIGQVISVGATSTTAEEVRRVTAISPGLAPGTLTLNAALYQAHGTGAAGTVFAYTFVQGIQHNFSQLNSQPSAPAGYVGAGGFTAAQPPTYTIEDFTGITASVGARNYAYACFSELSLTLNAQALAEWDGKVTALASAIAGSQPSTILSGVPPYAAWNTTVTVAGAGTSNTADAKLTLTRRLAPKFTNSGQQDAFAIARSYLEAALSFDFNPASDETEFGYYLNNTQPVVQIVASNNLSGTNAASVTVKAQVAAFDTGELDETKDAFGFQETVKCVSNTTNAGPSGGKSPVVVSLVNGVINY